MRVYEPARQLCALEPAHLCLRLNAASRSEGTVASKQALTVTTCDARTLRLNVKLRLRLSVGNSPPAGGVAGSAGDARGSDDESGDSTAGSMSEQDGAMSRLPAVLAAGRAMHLRLWSHHLRASEQQSTLSQRRIASGDF